MNFTKTNDKYPKRITNGFPVSEGNLGILAATALR
jgi:hypothetical protein